MRKRIQIFVAVIAALLASGAYAQIVPFGTLGGGSSGTTTIISGTTPITGGGDTQLCFNDAATLSCGDAGFTYVKGTDKATLLGGLTIGSVTTAGRATLILQDTIGGASATDNFLTITATHNTTPTNTEYGISYIIASGGSAAFQQNGMLISQTAGYTGASQTAGLIVQNAAAATTTDLTSGNKGIHATATGSGAGWNIALSGNANSSTALNAAVVGRAITATGTPTLNTGVFGIALNGTNNIAGYFALTSSTSTAPTGNAALIANNGAVAANIFEARDNGTAVVTIADGGGTTIASNGGLTITGSTTSLSVGASPTLQVLATSDSVNFNAASASTSAMTKLVNTNSNSTGTPGAGFGTGQKFSMESSTTNTVDSGSVGFRWSDATHASRSSYRVTEAVANAGSLEEVELVGVYKGLSDNVLANIAVQTLGNDTGGGGSIRYCVYAADATTAAAECGNVDYAGVDVTAGAGGEVCPTPTKVGTPLQALSGATLAVTFAAATGTDLCTIQVTANPNIATPTALWIRWSANNSGRTLTPQ